MDGRPGAGGGRVGRAVSGRRRTDAERLGELAGRKRAIDARMQAIRARAEQRRRKEDTRRKILLGAWILREMDGPEAGERLRKWAARRLPGFVQERDRHLFDGIGLDIRWDGPETPDGEGGADTEGTA